MGLGQQALLAQRSSPMKIRQELLIDVDAIWHKYANLLFLPVFSLASETGYVSILHWGGWARGDIRFYIIGLWPKCSFCRCLTLPIFRLARRLLKLIKRVEGINDLSIRMKHSPALGR